MGRPIKQGVDYFPHDTHASTDEKIEALCALYGNDGYAFYFRMCERIYNTRGAELDISDIETRQILAKKCHMKLSRWEQILHTCARLQLFSPQQRNRGLLTSEGIKRRFDSVSEKRKQERIRYEEEKQLQLNNNGVSAAETMQEPGLPITETHQSFQEVKEVKEVKSTPLPPAPTSGGEVFKKWEQEIGMLTPMIAERVGVLIEEQGETRVIRAITIAANSGARNLRYVEGIFERAGKGPLELPRRQSNSDKQGLPADPTKYHKGKYAAALAANIELSDEAHAAGFGTLPAYMQHLEEERLKEPAESAVTGAGPPG